MSSCSLNIAKKYLMKKGLIDKNMTVTSSTDKVSAAIKKLTALAKTNYFVDYGSLFSMRQDISPKDGYVVKLIPNEGAFSAIDDVSEFQNIVNIPYNLDSKIDINITELGEEGTMLISYLGEKIGHIYGSIDGSNFNVEMSNIDSRYTGRGIGAISYIKAGAELNKLGLILRSDKFAERMTDSATGMWDKLVRAGLAVKGEERYELLAVPSEPTIPITNTQINNTEQEGDLPSIEIKC